MTPTSRRSETALIRPFAGLSPADEALDQVRLNVSGASYEHGAVVLPQEDLTEASLTIALPSPDRVRDLVEMTPVPVVDCGLIVLATARTHRASAVLLQQYLKKGDWPSEFFIDRHSADLVLNDVHGFQIIVAIVLLHDLTPEPLRPNLAGTWLARRDFSITAQTEDTSFSPEALTPEIRQHYGLPDGTMHYVHAEAVLDEESVSDAVQVYIDQTVLDLLHARPNDPVSIQVQTDLAVKTTEAIIISIVSELGMGGGIVTVDALSAFDAPSRFISSISSRLGISPSEVLDHALARATFLRSLLEASFGMHKAVVRALKEV